MLNETYLKKALEALQEDLDGLLWADTKEAATHARGALMDALTNAYTQGKHDQRWQPDVEAVAQGHYEAVKSPYKEGSNAKPGQAPNCL